MDLGRIGGTALAIGGAVGAAAADVKYGAKSTKIAPGILLGAVALGVGATGVVKGSMADHALAVAEGALCGEAYRATANRMIASQLAANGQQVPATQGIFLGGPVGAGLPPQRGQLTRAELMQRIAVLKAM